MNASNGECLLEKFHDSNMSGFRFSFIATPSKLSSQQLTVIADEIVLPERERPKRNREFFGASSCRRIRIAAGDKVP